MLLNARESAERLGIKLDTLYAYVSRGLLRSVAVPGSRERHYEAEEVERLRARRGGGRAARGAGAETLIPVIASAICLIEDGRLYYRGVDALRLAETASLEEAAALLWGEGADMAPHPPTPAAAWVAPSSRVRGEGPGEGRGAGSGDRQLALIERCQVRLARLASADLTALDLSRAGVIRTGGRIVAELADCAAEGAPGPGPVHRRLAAAWGLDRNGAEILRRCLVLLADHELNASTFVARCIASTGATPYAVVAGALAALSGRRHGGASVQAEVLLHEIAAGGDPMAVMAARLARDEQLPGLGQPLYPAGDPGAVAILDAVGAAFPAARERLERTVEAAVRLSGRRPNVDFALAAAMTALGLPHGAALAVFVVGRAVGWIAHAIEQYQSSVLIRPRARYTGPRPQP